MKKKNNTRPQPIPNPWLRVSISLGLALSLALLLFLLPAAGSSARITVPALPLTSIGLPDTALDISLPFGPSFVQATNGLTITKTAPKFVEPGGLITYTFTITNNTSQHITQAIVTEILPSNTTCGPNHAEPDTSIYPRWGYSCSAPAAGWVMFYNPWVFPISFTRGTSNTLMLTVRVDDDVVDGTEIVNDNFTVEANDSTFTDSGPPVTTTVVAPTWEITKTVSSPTVEPGQFLTYTITITNNGSTATSGAYTITDVLPNDTVPGSVVIDPQPPGVLNGDTVTWVFTDSLAAGNTKMLTYSVQTTQPLTHGHTIVNQTYQVSGGNVYTDAVGTPVTVTVAAPATLTVVKVASPDPVQAGDLLTYTITITNDATSTGPASTVLVSDTLPGEVVYQSSGIVGGSGTITDSGNPILWQLDDPIPVGKSVQVTVTVRVTSPMLPGFITNTFGASAVNAPLISDSITTEVTATNKITLSKSVDPTVVVPGDVVTYTVILTNSGNSIATVSLTDILPAGFVPAVHTQTGLIVPGRTPSTSAGTNTATFTATTSITPGMYYNQVVTATYDLTQTSITKIAPVHVVNAVISMAKVANASSAGIGDTITYTYYITNTGDITLTTLSLTDDPLGFVNPLSLTLGIGDSTTGVATTTVSESDLPGPITNTATVTGTFLGSNTTSITATESVDIDYTTSISVEKSFVTSAGVPANIGDTITYTYRITNTGTVTLYNSIILNDDKLGVTNLGIPYVPLAPGQSTIFSNTTVVREADLPGPLTNTVTVTGTNVLAETTIATDTASVPLTYTTGISVEKSFVASAGTPARIGDTITYTYRITNTGTVTLYNSIILNDDKLGVTSLGIPYVPLAPGQITIFSNTTMVREADLPGPLTNTVTVTGTNNLAETIIATDTASVPLTYTIGITINKTASQALATPGDMVTYTYRITNTGDITLTVVLYDDELNTYPPLSPSGIVGPGGSVTATAVNLVNTADLPGPIINTAIVTGTNNIVSKTVVATTTATVELTYTVVVSLQKIANPLTATVGELVTYTYLITNSGQAPLDLTLIDDKLGPLTPPLTPLPPGLSTQVITTHTISELDLVSDYPVLTNTATITGAYLTATVVETDTAAVTLVYTPSITLVKTANTILAAPGDTITYTYHLTNTGPLTVTITALDDDPLGSLMANLGTTTLPPYNGYTTATITYSVEISDTPAITNTVVVTGNDTLGRVVTDTDQVVVNVEDRLTTISAINSSPNSVFIPTYFTVTTNITNGVTYEWNFADGSSGSGINSQNTYTTVGTYTVIVTASNSVSTITDTTVVTITPGPTVRFDLQATSPQVAGNPFTITITALDAYNNPTTFSGQANITDDTGTIAPISVIMVNGITATQFVVTQATSLMLDTITATDNATGLITGTVDVEIVPDEPTTLIVTANPNPIHICETALVTTTLMDQYNNPTPNEPISLSLLGGSPPGTGIIQPNSGNTDADGIVTSIITGTTSGNIRILGEWDDDLTINNFPGYTLQVITPSIPTALTVMVSPNSVPVGNTATITAEVRDCLGQPSVGTVVTFSITTGYGTITPITGTVNAGGFATTTITAGPTEGPAIIAGTTGSITDTTSFNVQPASAPQLSIIKFANPSGNTPVYSGSNVTYWVVVSNTGTASATNLIITDTLANTGFVTGSITSGGLPVVNGNVITFTVSSLGINATVTATVEVTVTTTVSGTTITNRAQADSDETPPTVERIVTHPVITRTTSPGTIYLPIILKNYTPQAPDLIISDVLVSNTSPNTGDPVDITVTLHNTGTGFSTGFWVDLYLSTSPINPQVNQTWDEAFDDSLVPYGVAWKVYGMPTDGDFVISNLNPNDLIPGGTCNNYSNFIPNGLGCWPQTWKGIPLNNYFRDPGTYYLYVRVDSLDEVSGTNPNGMVVETNENNNLYSGSPIIITVGGAPIPAASPLQTSEVTQPVENRGRSTVAP